MARIEYTYVCFDYRYIGYWAPRQHGHGATQGNVLSCPESYKLVSSWGCVGTIG